MKICIISPVALPLLGRKQKYGGIESVVSTVAEQLTLRGHEVLVFASGDSEIEAKIVPVVPEALGIDVDFETESSANLAAYEQALREKPDVIWDNTLASHAHVETVNKSYSPFQANLRFKMGNLLETGTIPVVQTLHGPAEGYLAETAGKLSKAGHFFVSISRDQAIGYLDNIASGQHLGTIYSPVDIDLFYPNPESEGKYLLWVGRFGMEKGSHIALAAAHLAGIPITLIGKKLQNFEKEYFKKFIEPELRPEDRFIELADAETRAEYYRNAKAVLMTNLWHEPFGMVLAEAMASGQVVIGPAMGSLTELIDYAGVLIPVDDLRLTPESADVTEEQRRYIERVSEHIVDAEDIPFSVPRKRAEFLFAPKRCAIGYEEAFLKAIYLRKRQQRKAD